MCIKPPNLKSEAPAAVDQPIPAPIPTTSLQNETTAETNRKKLAALKFGALNTIKTSGQGVAGTGPNLQTPAIQGANKTLGA